jgi:hypothetical protein
MTSDRAVNVTQRSCSLANGRAAELEKTAADFCLNFGK